MALTTFMRSWQDFEFVTLATLPMFLFSATFFPVTAFPTGGAVGRGGARRSTAAWCCAASSPPARCPGARRSRSSTWSRWALVGLAIVRRRLDKLLLT